LSTSPGINCVIITFGTMLSATLLTLNGETVLANQVPAFKSGVLEEIRENVMEVRLALQKGDLIEALQHLNNVDEDLLLLETELKPSDSTSSYGNFNNSDSTSNSQTLNASEEEGGISSNKSNYDYAELGQGDTQPKSPTPSISDTTLNMNGNALSQDSGNSNNTIRKLNVTINSIFINDNHDILYPGEWQLDAYVNNKRIHLSDNTGLDRAESGQAINFKDKSITLEVPENSTLRVVTVGAELDEGVTESKYKVNGSSVDEAGQAASDGVLPDISGILDTKAPLPEYRDKVEDSIQFLTTYDRNDAVGIIASEYDTRNNFGVGDHLQCSESTGEVGDIFDTVDTNCDYRLSYTIEEI
jgi:hypothetical protein